MAPTVAPLHGDRVRRLRWEGAGVDLGTVVARLHEQQAELTQQDSGDDEHPHPRNCVLNLVVVLGDRHRALACDRVVAGLAPSHPMRAILVHLGSGGGGGTLDAGQGAGTLDAGQGPGTLDVEITTEAHQLVRAFPVQRQQVLLHVRGAAAEHLASLVEPLLVTDVTTYLWWSGRERLEERTLRDAIAFSDVLVVDSMLFERPTDGLLKLAELVAEPEARIGIADFRWSRLQPWRDAISQFFAPANRRPLLAGLRELEVEAAGRTPADRAGAALLAGWIAAALGWRLDCRALADATEAVVHAEGGLTARLRLTCVPNERLSHGELLTVRLAGRAGGRSGTLTIERDRDGGRHAHVTIELSGGEPVRQRLSLPRMDEADLLVHALLSGRHDPRFHRALTAATPLLVTMQ